jgi:hypothetical protein
LYNGRVPRARFEAELIEGHKGVTVVIVPFDPELQWSRKPVRLDARRHGWPIAGTANGARFDGFIGERWGRFFIIVEPALRGSAGVAVGDTLALVVAPTASRRALERARDQAKLTTAPREARADAIDPPGASRAGPGPSGKRPGPISDGRRPRPDRRAGRSPAAR